jgi:hypothetical protein
MLALANNGAETNGRKRTQWPACNLLLPPKPASGAGANTEGDNAFSNS